MPVKHRHSDKHTCSKQRQSCSLALRLSGQVLLLQWISNMSRSNTHTHKPGCMHRDWHARSNFKRRQFVLPLSSEMCACIAIRGSPDCRGRRNSTLSQLEKCVSQFFVNFFASPSVYLRMQMSWLHVFRFPF